MHEPAPTEPGAYQPAYTTAVARLNEQVELASVTQWCGVGPGSLAPEVCRRLRDGDRLATPVLVFNWETS